MDASRVSSAVFLQSKEIANLYASCGYEKVINKETMDIQYVPPFSTMKSLIGYTNVSED